jgi:hypothetical protein
VRRVRQALPLMWLDGEPSPSVARTGEWQQTAARGER